MKHAEADAVLPEARTGNSVHRCLNAVAIAAKESVPAEEYLIFLVLSLE
jgi:hypothetical protein